MEKAKERDMNFELLRIISMILIVGSHYIVHGKILENVEIFSTNYFIAEFIRVFTRVAVNLYVLITGYYMINSKAKVKKVFNLWTIIEFYSVAILIIAILAGEKTGLKQIIKSKFEKP